MIVCLEVISEELPRASESVAATFADGASGCIGVPKELGSKSLVPVFRSRMIEVASVGAGASVATLSRGILIGAIPLDALVPDNSMLPLAVVTSVSGAFQVTVECGFFCEAGSGITNVCGAVQSGDGVCVDRSTTGVAIGFFADGPDSGFASPEK